MLTRNWWFKYDSAIYQKLGRVPVSSAQSDQVSADTIIEIFDEDEPVYRYFWGWSLPPATFTPHESLNGYAYDDLPAVWVEGDHYIGWIEIWERFIGEKV